MLILTAHISVSTAVTLATHTGVFSDLTLTHTYTQTNFPLVSPTFEGYKPRNSLHNPKKVSDFDSAVHQGVCHVALTPAELPASLLSKPAPPLASVSKSKSQLVRKFLLPCEAIFNKDLNKSSDMLYERIFSIQQPRLFFFFFNLVKAEIA